MSDHLKNHWLKLWQTLNAKGDGLSVFFKIVQAYTKDDRYYHNLYHIKQCLQILDKITLKLTDVEQIETAIWFHDFVHDPKLRDNEAQSAEQTKRILSEAGLSNDFINNVNRLIISTQHKFPPLNSDEKYLTDIDLSILGQDKRDLDLYECNIRKEFSWLSDSQYRAGRIMFLNKLMERPNLFSTDYFKKLYEENARKNISRLVLNLSNQEFV